jgi:membrane fusion protein, multidrug efflux system
MKRSTKVTTIIVIFFLIIAIVVIGRIMIGNHFAKKFSKRPPPGIIVTEVIKTNFSEKIESFGTAVSKKNESFRIKRSDLITDLDLKEYVKKGELILKLKDKDIIAPFSGVLGFRGITGDILDSNNSIIITLDDNSTIYSDLKIPEVFANVIKKGLPIKAKFSGNKDKVYDGAVYAVSSRINAETRSLLIRVEIDNEDTGLIPGSLLEVTVNYNERNSIGIPDTSIMLEGDKIYVYKVSEKNVTEKTEIKTGIRSGGFVEVISGLNEGEDIVAEGLKKVRSKGKIKPIKK